MIAVLRNPSDTSQQRHPSRTIEAFAEVLELQVVSFESFLARKEESILRGQGQNEEAIVVSLLSLEASIRSEYSDSFDELFEIVCLSLPGLSWVSFDRILGRIRLSPSSFSSRLLDCLFDAMQRSRAFGDYATESWLKRVFLRTAAPVWKMLGHWLRDGIFMPESSNSVYDQSSLPLEFFIESNGLDITDTDFWAQGYCFRTRFLSENVSIECPDVPIFLQSLVDKILGAGKSIGLLRILGHNQGVKYGELSPAAWPTFETFIFKLFEGDPLLDARISHTPNTHLSSENLSLLLSDHLLPICTGAEATLKDVLYSECDLLHHLHVVEDLLLSRRGDIMADFCDVLFSAVSRRLSFLICNHQLTFITRSTQKRFGQITTS